MNNEEKKLYKIRLGIITGVVVAFVLYLLINLFSVQVVHGNEYMAKSIASNATSETVNASRGIITDRNNKVLVSNRVSYTITFSSSSFNNDDDMNSAITRLLRLCNKYDVSWKDSLPLSSEAPYNWLQTQDNEDFQNFLKKNKLYRITESDAFLDDLRDLFGLAPGYSDAQARAIVGLRYELFLHSSYVVADDISVDMINEIVDGNYKGVITGTSSARVYNTDCACHILGRISRIYAEDWKEYQALGYSMDAIVGESGVERAFEKYLCGSSGTRLITADKEGKVTGELYTTEPKPGGTVALTIDIDLQEATEKALASTINAMNDKDSDSRGGGAAVIEVGTGDVLALASYPTYNLSTFNEDYSSLLEDARLPLFNRSTDGAYAPGSTFKMVTAVAALENGIITPYTQIKDKGIYTYYEDPQPMCWVWRSGHTTHGIINVTDAIEVSCNYFFYEVGRLTGIDNINDYASQFGLGKSTGIEIGDTSGSLASETYADSHKLEWSEGQTLTAAIGQSYNLFSPIQLANYIATLVGDGEHYDAHLLKSVKSYDNSKLLYVYDEEPTNVVEMEDSTKRAVLTGMHNLTTGSLESVFKKCVVECGAKTGSAQVGTDIANGVFVAYAPYDDPEIAVAIVIEKGGSGAALASTAVEIINAYFTENDVTSSTIAEGIMLH